MNMKNRIIHALGLSSMTVMMGYDVWLALNGLFNVAIFAISIVGLFYGGYSMVNYTINSRSGKI